MALYSIFVLGEQEHGKQTEERNMRVFCNKHEKNIRVLF